MLQVGALFQDVTSAMYVENNHVPAINYVYGIGGRDTKSDDIQSVYMDLLEIVKEGRQNNGLQCKRSSCK